MSSLDVAFNTENTRAGQSPVSNTFPQKMQFHNHELRAIDSAELFQLQDRNSNPEPKMLF